MEPASISPNPPALLTAEAGCHLLHHTIPPCIMGYFIPKKLQILFMLIIVNNEWMYRLMSCPLLHSKNKLLGNALRQQ